MPLTNAAVLGDQEDTTPALFGDSNRVLVQRALADLTAGRPVCLRHGPFRQWVLAVDGLDAQRLAAFRTLATLPSQMAGLELLLTEQRGLALGLDVAGPFAVSVSPGDTLNDIVTLASAHGVMLKPRAVAASTLLASGALELAKLAYLLPALIAGPVERLGVLPLALPGSGAAPHPLLGAAGGVVVDAEAILRFRRDRVASIRRVSDARIPICDDMETRVIAFRDDVGDLALAIIIGQPDFSRQAVRPMPVRIHSACLTGDILGSRRCDCGEQLWLAIRRLHQLGGGCLLYLDQEGRGLGLVNKLRAYALQDSGLDTVDANMTLGYHDDERDYAVAGVILAALGVQRVTLLTNNPLKLSALLAAGIEVAERTPVLAEVQDDNRRYMETKARRSGHWLDVATPPS
jgi:GTP cyclohydrolase II